MRVFYEDNSLFCLLEIPIIYLCVDYAFNFKNYGHFKFIVICVCTLRSGLLIIIFYPGKEQNVEMLSLCLALQEVIYLNVMSRKKITYFQT